jgi:hypothetical protein
MLFPMQLCQQWYQLLWAMPMSRHVSQPRCVLQVQVSVCVCGVCVCGWVVVVVVVVVGLGGRGWVKSGPRRAFMSRGTTLWTPGMVSACPHRC